MLRTKNAPGTEDRDSECTRSRTSVRALKNCTTEKEKKGGLLSLNKRRAYKRSHKECQINFSSVQTSSEKLSKFDIEKIHV